MSQRRGTRMLARVLSHMRVICEKKKARACFRYIYFLFFFSGVLAFHQTLLTPGPGPPPISFFLFFPAERRPTLRSTRTPYRPKGARTRTTCDCFAPRTYQPSGNDDRTWPPDRVAARSSSLTIFYLFLFFKAKAEATAVVVAAGAVAASSTLKKKKTFHACFYQHGHH